jgi:asparaginyl-tRNA synthetase
VINDGSTFDTLQVIADQSIDNYDNISKMMAGTSVAINGIVKASQGGKQTIELEAKSVEIIGEVSTDYPLQKKATSLEFLRDNAHLRGRTNTFNALFRVSHLLSFAVHQFFHDNGYYHIHTPIITASDCEGAGELFRVSTLPSDKLHKNFEGDYFGKETFLGVSGQLEAEALALGLGKVYTFGPTFRSENSNTSRHLAEFWMIEPEVAFAELDDVAHLAEDFIIYLINFLFEKAPKELEFFEKFYQKGLRDTLKNVANSKFKKVTYTEAVDILKNSGEKFEFQVDWGTDLQTEHERFLTEKHFKAPVIVTDYPAEIKAFYMKMNPDHKTVRAMDVLVPGVGEIIGGSQREDNIAILKDRMAHHGLDEADYDWYLDLRRFGSAPHAGFGMGFERMLMYITGIQNIRDAIPFPRTPKNCRF